MASFFGSRLQLECTCGEPLTIPIREKGVERTADGYDVTLVASLREVRTHVAEVHPDFVESAAGPAGGDDG